MLVGGGAIGKVIRRNTSRGLVIEKHIDMQQNDTIKLRSFAREIKAYLRLGLHPCIAKYHSNHFNGTALIIEMEYAAGGDLHTWAANHSRRRAAFGDDELLRMALRFGGHVVSAIRHMHSMGLTDGDIKLENFVITSSFVAKKIDFGSAVDAGAPGHVADLPCTLQFAAPEVLTLTDTDRKKADVYSVGIVMYGLSTSTTPFNSARNTDPTFAHYSGMGVGESFARYFFGTYRFYPSSPAKLAATMDILDGMLKINPADRFDIDQVAVALLAMGVDVPGSTRLTCPSTPTFGA